eukprot:g5914.t1
MSEETSSSGLAPGVDVAVHCQTALDDDVAPPTANVEHWHPTLQEFCKNQPPPPTQHPSYLTNPLAATQQAYGLWSSQIHPPLLTPYGPMPFFGGFFPGPYPLPTSLTPVKPEDLSGANELHERKKQKLMMRGGHPSATGSTPRQVHHGLSKTAAPSVAVPLNSNSEMLGDIVDEIGCTGATTGDDGWGKSKSTSISAHLQVKDEKELKREKRKQSNRESARRSRLRKQKECETLQKQVHDLLSVKQQLEQQLMEQKRRISELERENQDLKSNWSS